MMTSSNGTIFRVTGPLWVTGEFPAQRPMSRSLDVFFDLHLNTRLSKQSRGWWFETLSGSLWRHCNAMPMEYPDWYGWNWPEPDSNKHNNAQNKMHGMCCKWQVRNIFPAWKLQSMKNRRERPRHPQMIYNTTPLWQTVRAMPRHIKCVVGNLMFFNDM